MIDVVKIAKELTKEQGTNDPFKLAKSLGIHLLYSNLGSKQAYYVCAYRVQMIVINDCIPYDEQYFACAHELGHAVMCHNHNTGFIKKHTFYSTDGFEIQANNFAVELLFCSTTADAAQVDKIFKKYGTLIDFMPRQNVNA